MSENSRWVWIPDKSACFAKAKLVSDNEQDATCLVSLNGETQTVPASQVCKVNPAQFDRANDIAELTYLNEPSVVNNLSSRYSHGQIYTYSGLFLVAVNPYKTLAIYGDDVVSKFKNKRREDTEPHIYAVAEQAYREMLSTMSNQSILVTGESGAGKTENTKKVIRYLSAVTGSKVKSEAGHGIDQRILQTNPVLEAFGNAQTIRNSNSSRFGKFIRIEFGSKGRISGASIEWYLLEKSRVVTQAAEERNYHIFYQLLKGASDTERKRWSIDANASPADFEYLKNSVSTIVGIDDGQKYGETVEAFKIMGFSTETVNNIMEIVAAILHLGNIQFAPENADQGKIVNPNQVTTACRLLGVSAELFTKAVLRPRVKAGRDLVTQSRTAAQGQFTVGAVAKALYERLFGHIVSELNERLGSSGSQSSFIGVLDIAGFEIFRNNSFEQLCINYTNEKLQQFFNHHMFVLEQEEYVKEEIDWEYVDYGADLQPTIDLIEKVNPMGIMSCLDEECLVPGATDQTFTDKLVERWQGKNSKFSTTRLGQAFVVNHYAMAVEYSTDGWLDKNRDPLNESVVELLTSSNRPLVNKLFKSTAKADDGSRRGKVRSVAQKHREQLNDLMTQLESTNPHFVRCIIPNKTRSPDKFENALVLDQLRCNGVLEGIRIARAGYPNRLDFSDFCKRYHVLASSEPVSGATQRACSAILQRLRLEEYSYKVGLTKVFFRNGVLAELEDKLDALVKSQTLLVQSFARGFLVRRQVRAQVHKKEAIKTLSRAISTWKGLSDDPWWKLLAAQRPLLDSEENLESNRKDMRIHKLQETLSRFRTEKDKQDAALESLTSKLSATTEERDATKAELLAESDKKNRLAEKAKTEISELKEAISSLKGEKTSIAASLTQATSELAGLKDTKEKLTQQVSDVEKTRDERQKELVDLRKTHDSLKSEHTQLGANHKKTEDQYRKLVEEHKAVTQQSSKHESNIKSLQSEKAQLTADKNKLSAKVDELTKAQENLSALDEQYKAKLKDAEASKTSLESLKAKHSALDTQHTKLKSDYNSLQEAHSKVKAEVGSVKSARDTLSASLAALKTEKASLAASHEKLQEEHRNLQKQHKSLGAQKTADKTAEKKFEAEIASLRSQLASLQDTLKKSTLEAQEKAKRVSELESEVTSNSATISQLQSAAKELEEKNKSLKEQADEFDLHLSPSRSFSGSKRPHSYADGTILFAAADGKGAEEAHLRRALTHVPRLREKVERLQREKEQLLDDRSRMIFNMHDQKSYNKELEIEKAKNCEVKKLQSEIRILKLQLVRSERDRKAAESAVTASANEDVAQLTQKLRLAELSKVQLQQQLLRLQAKLDDQQSMTLTTGSRSSPTRIPSAPRAAESQLMVQKRDIPRALRIISNDRRVSEQIFADATEKIQHGTTPIQETINIYKLRAEEFHAELEKAELVVAAAVRNEEAAQSQLKALKQRTVDMEKSHAAEMRDVHSKIVGIKQQLADCELELSLARENERVVKDLESQLNSVSMTLDEVKSERDRLLENKSRLERRLETSPDLGDRSRRLAEQLAGVQRDIRIRERVIDDLRWQVERRDKLVDQLKRTLADSDNREEHLRETIDRLQANDSAKDVALRRANRDSAQAREQTLILEQELRNYQPKSMKQHTSSSDLAFI